MRKKKKKFFDLRDEYKKCWSFIKDSRIFIYSIMIIFFIFALFGFFVPVPESLSNIIYQFIEELLKKTEGMSLTELMGFIFLNNMQTSFFGIVFGVLFGLFPLILTIANGYIVGFVASLSVQSGGIFVLWRIFPHGIFELPAVFISLGLGLRLGMFIFQKKKVKSFRDYFWNSLKVFLLVVIPLLIIGSIIESSLIFAR